MKQVILIRTDLNMRKGKMVAQGAHASMAFLLDYYLDVSNIDSPHVREWLNHGQTKICLQVHSKEELLELHREAKEMGLLSHYITDAGRTEFNGIPTVTSLAIGPNSSDEINKITGHLKLY